MEQTRSRETDDAAQPPIQELLSPATVRGAESDITVGDTALMKHWAKRCKHLTSDFAVAGWMLSPLPWVMDDCRENNRGSHRLASKWKAYLPSFCDWCRQVMTLTFDLSPLLFLPVERVIDKLYAGKSRDAIGSAKNEFWTEWDDFVAKRGDSYGRKHIWNSSNLCDGRVHIWHQQNSLPFTNVLGYVACRVTSKILGIGAAERSWGDVKCIKTGKRSSIRGGSLKKQSVIYGAASMEKSRILNEGKKHQGMFDEDDIKFDAVLEASGREIEQVDETNSSSQKKTLRIFRAWLEDWERDRMFKPNDHVAEARYLKKYGGLKWLDPDNNNCVLVAATDRCEYVKCHGWSIVSMVVKKGDEDTIEDDDDDEPWSPTQMLIDQIASASDIQDPKYDFRVAHDLEEENAILLGSERDADVDATLSTSSTEE